MIVVRTVGLFCLLSTIAPADVVINEILYNAPDDLYQLEFIELCNTGRDRIDLAGWKLSGEVTFEFPIGSIVAAEAFVVVAKDSKVLKDFYGVDAVGEFKKSLSNSGGELNLSDSKGNLVESVSYRDRAPWPLAADGYSASIERVYSRGPANLAVNWAPSKLSDDYDSKPSGSPGVKNSVTADSVPPAIQSVDWQPKQLSPGGVLSVSIQPASADAIAAGEVRYRLVAPGNLGEEQSIALQRRGEQLVAELPAGDEPNRLLRFRIVAKNRSGGVLEFPHQNEVRPAFTVHVSNDLEMNKIPHVQFFYVGKTEYDNGEQYREAQAQPARRDRFRGFGPPGGFGGPPEFGRGFPGPPGDRPRERPTQQGEPQNELRGRPSVEPFPGRDFDREFRRGGFGGRGFPGRGGGFGSFPSTPLLPQGAAAIVYTEPETGKSEVYDFINIVQRKSGWKARFHKDRPLLGMSTVNFLFEPDQRTTLNESLAYDLYSLAGNKSYQHGFMRVAINGKPAGYHLYFEQPNGRFFQRHEINDKGDLYKLIWMGSAEMSPRVPDQARAVRPDITSRYEKKSNRHKGHQDLVSVIESLENAKSDTETWQIIDAHFEVDQVINYFAVNSLLSHWDGFFNNYFVYFDRKGTGKWSLYPWDQDSTWSQRGGAGNDLYEMPLYFGAEGATPDGHVKPAASQQADRRRFGGPGFGGPFGGRGFGGRGFGWWRPGGDFSRPMLANPTFYRRFQQRLAELTKTVFTEENFGPRIDQLRPSLDPEVRFRARIRNEDEEDAAAELDAIIASLREHLAKRRAFVISKLPPL